MYKPRMKSGVRAVLRQLRGVGKEDFRATQNEDKDLEQPKIFDARVQILAKRRMHEIEAKKAMITSQMRHERWKAGGPV